MVYGAYIEFEILHYLDHRVASHLIGCIREFTLECKKIIIRSYPTYVRGNTTPLNLHNLSLICFIALFSEINHSNLYPVILTIHLTAISITKSHLID